MFTSTKTWERCRCGFDLMYCTCCCVGLIIYHPIVTFIFYVILFSSMIYMYLQQPYTSSMPKSWKTTIKRQGTGRVQNAISFQLCFRHVSSITVQMWPHLWVGTISNASKKPRRVWAIWDGSFGWHSLKLQCIPPTIEQERMISVKTILTTSLFLLLNVTTKVQHHPHVVWRTLHSWLDKKIIYVPHSTNRDSSDTVKSR